MIEAIANILIANLFDRYNIDIHWSMILIQDYD
jgi:hypothetical protein